MENDKPARPPRGRAAESRPLAAPRLPARPYMAHRHRATPATTPTTVRRARSASGSRRAA
ncbi:hypothetical protein IM697_25125 [Streptomyces ferrugineus]|uniref:Uncharacterized protein n=1 Tax=Streptomyces ferrugineus TaxID=1413221 RepID=A0A7M2SAV3_9ACTN|nr:hypothetical protein [Streptomyces ferrugineus]QOV33490.1 hypothetical protein IM697_25125 [Streptomyces ferrugineus]